MSEAFHSFIELSLQGKVLLEEIDDFVDAWHEGGDEIELHDFLGMNEVEYSLWVREPDTLAYIIKARHDRVDLERAIVDDFREYKMAARADENAKLAQLEAWLKQLNGLN